MPEPLAVRPGRRRVRRAGAVLLACFALAACGPDPSSESALSEAAFVETYIALERARTDTTDTVAFADRKARILAEHGTSEQELRKFVETRDLETMAAVWDTIGVLLSQPEAERPPR